MAGRELFSFFLDLAGNSKLVPTACLTGLYRRCFAWSPSSWTVLMKEITSALKIVRSAIDDTVTRSAWRKEYEVRNIKRHVKVLASEKDPAEIRFIWKVFFAKFEFFYFESSVDFLEVMWQNRSIRPKLGRCPELGHFSVACLCKLRGGGVD